MTIETPMFPPAPAARATSPSIIPFPATLQSQGGGVTGPADRTTRRRLLMGIATAGLGTAAAGAVYGSGATSGLATGTALSGLGTGLTEPSRAQQLAIIKQRAEQLVEVLRSGYVVEGWTVDEALAENMLRSLVHVPEAELDEDGEGHDEGLFDTVQFATEHGQSLDWIFRGTPLVMVCDAAARSPRARALAEGQDAELLQLVKEYYASVEEERRAGSEFDPHEDRWLERRARREQQLPEALRQRPDDVAVGIPADAAKGGWYSETNEVRALGHRKWSSFDLTKNTDRTNTMTNTIVSTSWVPSEAARVRANEIVAAFDRWTKWCLRKTSGYAAAERAQRSAENRTCRLEDQIFGMKARTREGIAAKAGVVQAHPCPTAEMAQSLAHDMLALEGGVS